MNRRKNIYPKTIVNKIVQPSHTTSTSCKCGTDNEQNALLKYYDHMQSNDQMVEVCCSCGLIVNPKWPWLDESPDEVICDYSEKPVYRAVEEKINIHRPKQILIFCKHVRICKWFYLEIVDNKPSLENKHIYFSVSGCYGNLQLPVKLSWLCCFYTKRISMLKGSIFDEQNWESNMLPQLTSFYFDYIVELV